MVGCQTGEDVPMSAADTIAPPMLTTVVRGPAAWRRRDLAESDYRVSLSPACLDEIKRTVALIRAYPLPTVLLTPDEYPMPECRAAMAEIRRRLDGRPRFALVDRLPMDAMSVEEAKAVYWLLASLVARPVAQSLSGIMIYDVEDTGQKAMPGSGIRPDKTNIELSFHNDNNYNSTPPDYVGLLCLRPARLGGVSRVVDFATVHNEILRRRPDLMARFYRQDWFDRQREYRLGEPAVFAAPIFEYDGELRSRLSLHQIPGGYALTGEAMDDETQASLALLREIFAEDDLAVTFDFARGQMQFVHNRAIGHARTAFDPEPDPERRRHLVRLWLRDTGRRAYPG
jgi:alpha-ketoglutarate-dependent taurine dioxygenase